MVGANQHQPAQRRRPVIGVGEEGQPNTETGGQQAGQQWAQHRGQAGATSTTAFAVTMHAGDAHRGTPAARGGPLG